MKKSNLTAIVSGLAMAAASLAVSVPAQAQTTSNNWSMYTPGSAYVGLNAGRSRFNGPSGVGAFANDRNGNAYSLYGGNYFSHNFGFEVGYNDFGRVNRGGGTTRADGVSLSLVGRVPLGQSFNLLGRVGGTYVSTDVSAAPASGLATGRQNRFDLSYGLGAEFVFNPSWSAVVQYDEYNMRYPGSTRDRIDTTTVGLRYRF